MGRLIWVLSILVSIGSLAVCADVPKQSSGSNARASFLTSLEALPIEYRADIVLSSLETNHSLLKVQSVRRTVRGIYEAAGTSQRSYPVTLIANPGGDTVETQLSADLSLQHLDALNIRLRAVKLLALSEPRLAYHLFWKIPIEPLNNSVCGSDMVYSVSDYYRQVIEFSQTWRESGVANDAQLALRIIDHITALHSALSMAELADAIAGIRLKQTPLEQVSIAFEAYLDRTNASDRELGALLKRDRLIEKVGHLATSLKRNNIEAFGLLMALRKFLVESSQRACADSDVDRSVLLTGFNSLIESFQRDSSAKLSAADLIPRHIDVRALQHTIGPDDAIMPALNRLQQYWDRQTKGIEIQDKGEWEQAADDVLQYADHLDNQSDCDLCLFYRKFLLYYSLANFAPPGSFAQTVFAKYVNYLTATPVQASEPEAWIAKMKLFLNFSRERIDQEQAKRIAAMQQRGLSLMGLPTADGKAVITEMESSNDNVVKAYYTYEVLFRPKMSAPY